MKEIIGKEEKRHTDEGTDENGMFPTGKEKQYHIIEEPKQEQKKEIENWQRYYKKWYGKAGR